MPNMTPEEIEQAILRSLGDIAPEADLASLKPHLSLREQLDLDSMDFLNFVIAVHQSVGVEVPESDYPKLATLNGAVTYLAERLGAPR
jgi:acyl carrier protein